MPINTGYMSRPVAAALLLLTLAGCARESSRVSAASSTSSTRGPTTTSEAPTLDGETPITWGGIGQVKAGMTLAEVRELEGRKLVPEGFEDFEGFCWFAEFEGLEDDFSLLFLAPESTEPVDDPEKGVLGRVSTYGELDPSPARTEAGVGIGSTKSEVLEAYATDTVEVTPHHYAEGGEYIDVSGTQDPVPTMLRFETDGNDKVTAIHGGLPGAVRLVEGCA